MIPSSRTPEDEPHRCPICGHLVRIEPSTVPMQDAPCPHCGHLLTSTDSTESPALDQDATHAAAEQIPVFDYNAAFDQSRVDITVKNNALRLQGLDEFYAWELDQVAGNLYFYLPDQVLAFAPVQVIGSLCGHAGSWLWAWANPSIVAALTLNALTLKEAGELHQIPRLTLPTWPGTHEDAWAMTALAAKLCDAAGAYRGATDQFDLYMTFGAVTVVPP